MSRVNIEVSNMLLTFQTKMNPILTAKINVNGKRESWTCRGQYTWVFIQGLSIFYVQYV